MNPSPGEDPGVGVVREPRASDLPRFPVCAVKIVTHTNDPPEHCSFGQEILISLLIVSSK